MAAIGLQWRETTADAIYVQPNVPVLGTASVGSNWSGAYAELRGDSGRQIRSTTRSRPLQAKRSIQRRISAFAS
jgi:hypothetical protein